MAAHFNISEHEVVGHLVAFWCWVDTNVSPECPDVIGTKSGLDRVCGRSGMVESLIKRDAEETDYEESGGLGVRVELKEKGTWFFDIYRVVGEIKVKKKQVKA